MERDRLRQLVVDKLGRPHLGQRVLHIGADRRSIAWLGPRVGPLYHLGSRDEISCESRSPEDAATVDVWNGDLGKLPVSAYDLVVFQHTVRAGVSMAMYNGAADVADRLVELVAPGGRLLVELTADADNQALDALRHLRFTLSVPWNAPGETCEIDVKADLGPTTLYEAAIEPDLLPKSLLTGFFVWHRPQTESKVLTRVLHRPLPTPASASGTVDVGTDAPTTDVLLQVCVDNDPHAASVRNWLKLNEAMLQERGILSSIDSAARSHVGSADGDSGNIDSGESVVVATERLLELVEQARQGGTKIVVSRSWIDGLCGDDLEGLVSSLVGPDRLLTVWCWLGSPVTAFRQQVRQSVMDSRLADEAQEGDRRRSSTTRLEQWANAVADVGIFSAAIAWPGLSAYVQRSLECFLNLGPVKWPRWPADQGPYWPSLLAAKTWLTLQSASDLADIELGVGEDRRILDRMVWSLPGAPMPIPAKAFTAAAPDLATFANRLDIEFGAQDRLLDQPIETINESELTRWSSDQVAELIRLLLRQAADGRHRQQSTNGRSR